MALFSLFYEYGSQNYGGIPTGDSNPVASGINRNSITSIGILQHKTLVEVSKHRNVLYVW